MTKEEKIKHKLLLKQFCKSVLEERMAAAKHHMQEAQLAANSEEKSSAGDKYETSRAMGHLQKDMYARQLAECLKDLSALQLVRVEVVNEIITPGSFFTAGKQHFFIACGLGKQQVNEQVIFFLAPTSPLALKLQHKKTGQSFMFKDALLVIETLY